VTEKAWQVYLSAAKADRRLKVRFDSFVLEPHISYNALFRGKKDDIGGENGYIWGIFEQ